MLSLAEIGARVADTLAPIASPMVLLKAGPRRPDGAGGWLRDPPTPLPVLGWLADYTDTAKLAEMRPASTRKLVLLLPGCPRPPEIDDAVVIEGRTWTIEDVSRDPTGATATCQVR